MSLNFLCVSGCSWRVQGGLKFERQLHHGRLLEIHQLSCVCCHCGHNYRSDIRPRNPKHMEPTHNLSMWNEHFMLKSCFTFLCVFEGFWAAGGLFWTNFLPLQCISVCICFKMTCAWWWTLGGRPEMRWDANSFQSGRLWEHESQLYRWPDLLRVLRTVWDPAQHDGAQQGGQVHARYREEHLWLPRGQDRAQGEELSNHLAS